MKQIFVCTKCDGQFPKWSGRCEQCGSWGTISQDPVSSVPTTAKTEHKQALSDIQAATPVTFSNISTGEVDRISTHIQECDRVFGGGIVPGSLVLLGGDPGIGKSTLVAQIAGAIGTPVLYVSGEESATQVKLRLDRLHIEQSKLQFLAEENVEVICKTVIETTPSVVIIDSIQTVASSAVESEPGSINQIKAATVRFLEIAKETGIPIIIIGHVTKGGELGGPKTLEHIVDVVLYLEGDRHNQFRLLRGVKNRFGSTNEVGVFEMAGDGLREVENPSAIFLQDRSNVPGSCITAVTEGSRIFLLEVQALVNKTNFGFPQRKCSGFDVNRLNLLLAVLERRAGVSLDQHDVYINIVGGAARNEPAMDLAVCATIASALHDARIPVDMAVWGEVGLGGELRFVARDADRTKEAKRFGITKILSPKATKIKTLLEALQHMQLL